MLLKNRTYNFLNFMGQLSGWCPALFTAKKHDIHKASV